MFPLNVEMPVIKKDGTRTTLGDITGDVSSLVDDIETLGEGLDALDDRLDTAENKIAALENGLLLLGNKSIVLSTSDGTTTLVNLMNAALTALNSINPGTEFTGATHMKINYLLIPYTAASRLTVLLRNQLYAMENYSAVTSLNVFGPTYDTANNTLALLYGALSSPSTFYRQNLSASAATDLSNTVINNNVGIGINIDFYKKL